MSRRLAFLLLALSLSCLRAVAAHGDDGPPITITSPDTGTTFVYGDIKTHSLAWDTKHAVLVVHVTFTDSDTGDGQAQDDSHEFRLPGVAFNAAKGLFTATSAQGEVIPIARIKPVLFMKTIEMMPNAAVRILHPKGVIKVVLEAISPNDPAMHPAPIDPDGRRDVDLKTILD